MNKKELKKLNKDDLIEIIVKQQKHINRLNDEIYKEMAEHWEYENKMEKIVNDIIKIS